jgi:hypothetical protein
MGRIITLSMAVLVTIGGTGVVLSETATQEMLRSQLQDEMQKLVRLQALPELGRFGVFLAADSPISARVQAITNAEDRIQALTEAMNQEVIKAPLLGVVESGKRAPWVAESAVMP